MNFAVNVALDVIKDTIILLHLLFVIFIWLMEEIVKDKGSESTTQPPKKNSHR
jgi:hypothetical protein